MSFAERAAVCKRKYSAAFDWLPRRSEQARHQDATRQDTPIVERKHWELKEPATRSRKLQITTKGVSKPREKEENLIFKMLK
jgi:hypothetical protein